MDKQLFADLLTSMKEMVAIERGEFQPAEENIHRHFLPDSNKSESDESVEQVSKENPLARD